MQTRRVAPASRSQPSVPERAAKPEHRSPILLGAAQRVIANYENSAAVPVDAVAETMAAITIAIHQRQQDPGAAIDNRAGTELGRKLLEQLRAEVVQGWSNTGIGTAHVPDVLDAIDRVRDQVAPATPAGLDLLVEVAHDLQSPLTSILFLTETLQRGQSGPLTELQRWQLGLIYGAALGLSSVTSDVIELAQSGGHLLETEPVSFSLRATFDSLHDIVRPIAEEKQLRMRFLAPATDQRLGHPLALTRVLLNLTSNALKYTDEGFVEVEARDAASGDGRVEFSVRDSGRGIDAEVLQHLYEPFHPGRSPHGVGFSGTGLGLTICRKLIKAMGSDLVLETEPGKGTHFQFELALPASQLPLHQAYGKGRLKRAPGDRRCGRERRVAVLATARAERRSGLDRRDTMRSAVG